MNKPCPFCGSDIYEDVLCDGSERLRHKDKTKHCIMSGCYDDGVCVSPKTWNTRPIEDALKLENFKLRTALEQIHSDASYAKDYSKFARDLIQITTEALK